MSNPWKEQHLEGEYGFTGGEYSRSAAESVVAGEYEGREKAVECGVCGEESGYFRATVGHYQCSKCRALRVNGEWAPE